MLTVSKRLAIVSAIAFVLPLSSARVYADVTEERNPGYAPITWVTQEIKPRDYAALRTISDRVATGETWHVNLNSLGGDIDTALRMGRLLREREASVNIGTNAVCLSACVFLLAGGAQRGVQTHLGAVVGIHRPYDPNDQETTMDGQKRKQQEMDVRIKAFLSEVNIPLSLYEEMLRVRPSDVRILSSSELHKYGLNDNDPYWQDAQDTKYAKGYGLSKAEYLERKARAKTLCARYSPARTGNMFSDMDCENNVQKGLPPGHGL